MDELKTQIDFFNNPDLNTVGAELIDLYRKSSQHIQQAKNHFESAVERRWHCGKKVVENLELIESEVTQREFAEKLGITEAMVSNDKRAYLALLDEGAETWDSAKKLLEQKNINSTTRQWEKLPKLLTQPESERQKDNRAKDERRLQQLYREVEEIRQRNQNAQGGEVKSKAEEVESYIEDLQDNLKKDDPTSYEWKSRYYLDWVKSLGRDFITGNPADSLDPHHTDAYNFAGNTQEKLPDCFTIPVTRDLHIQIEAGNYQPTHKELSDALIRTMSLFIINHFKSE